MISKDVTYAFFLMHRILSTSDAVDILCLHYSNFCSKNKYQKSRTSIIIFPCRNLNKLSIKYQSYLKSTEIDALEQKVSVCRNPSDKGTFLIV